MTHIPEISELVPCCPVVTPGIETGGNPREWQCRSHWVLPNGTVLHVCPNRVNWDVNEVLSINDGNGHSLSLGIDFKKADRGRYPTFQELAEEYVAKFPEVFEPSEGQVDEMRTNLSRWLQREVAAHQLRSFYVSVDMGDALLAHTDDEAIELFKERHMVSTPDGEHGFFEYRVSKGPYAEESNEG